MSSTVLPVSRKYSASGHMSISPGHSIPPPSSTRTAVNTLGSVHARKDATSHQIAQIDFALYAVTEPEPNSITVQRPHFDDFAHFKESPAPLSIAPRPSPSGARVQAPKECSSNISSGAARRSRTDSGASWTSAAVTSESTGISPARKSRTRPLDHVANSRSKQPPSTDVSM